MSSTRNNAHTGRTPPEASITGRTSKGGSYFVLVGAENNHVTTTPRKRQDNSDLSSETMTKTSSFLDVMNHDINHVPKNLLPPEKQRVPVVKVTARPVSPRIFDLCKKVSCDAEKQKLLDSRANRLRRLRSLSASNLSSSNDSDLEEDSSPLLNRRSVSLKTLVIERSQDSSTSTSSWNSQSECMDVPTSKVLSSPCTSPSSGYNSGFGFSSPGCVSPTRCHSPTLTMEDSKVHDKDLLMVPGSGPGRPRRTSSHDSGVVGLSVSSPSSLDNSSNEDVSFHDISASSEPERVHRNPTKRPLLRRLPALDVRINDVNPSSREPLQSPDDEGFQESLKLVGHGQKPHASHHETVELKKTALTVRLKQPLKSPTFESLLSKFHRYKSLDGANAATAPSFMRKLSEPISVVAPPAVVISEHEEETAASAQPSSSSTTPSSVPTGEMRDTKHQVKKEDENTDARPTSARDLLSLLPSSSKSKLERKLSSSSSTSNLDSEDPDSAEEQVREESPRASVSWGKIRKVVHWSPFIQSFKKKYPWVQIAGHQGSFKAGECGTILKKYCEKEEKALKGFMNDVLRPYIPEYKGIVDKETERYVQMQDLLEEFDNPSVMDCKMGTRTYLEEELKKAKEKTKLRHDLYEKMICIDASAPTEEENKQRAITKPRYMQWREHVSSSATLGFRIEGIKKGEGHSNKKYYKVHDREEVSECFNSFIEGDLDIRDKYVKKLIIIRATMEASQFFKSHEVIGSSLLFVHDKSGKASVWMIDFGKTTPLPENQFNNHREPWREGENLEDGYLFGLDNMIQVWNDLVTMPSSNSNMRIH